MFALLVLIDSLTVVAVYALVLENTVGNNLFAAALLIGVVCVQTIRLGPSLTLYPWLAMLPIAFVMGVLIGAYPALDWSGPGDPEEMNFASVYPVIATVYAIGFSILGGMAHAICVAVRKRSSRTDS